MLKVTIKREQNTLSNEITLLLLLSGDKVLLLYVFIRYLQQPPRQRKLLEEKEKDSVLLVRPYILVESDF